MNRLVKEAYFSPDVYLRVYEDGTHDLYIDWRDSYQNTVIPTLMTRSQSSILTEDQESTDWLDEVVATGNLQFVFEDGSEFPFTKSIGKIDATPPEAENNSRGWGHKDHPAYGFES